MPRNCTLEKGPPAATAVQPRQLLSIGVMNGLTLAIAGKPLPLANRKARAILAFLALENTPVITRERLATLLWTESSEKHARNSLRQTLHELTQALTAQSCPLVSAQRDEIRLDRDAVDVDLHRVLRTVSEGRLDDLGLGSGYGPETLLAGYDDVSPDFAEWLAQTRRFTQSRLVKALERGFQSLDLPSATRRHFADATLRLDPLHEAACRTLMSLTAEAGEVGVALRVYGNLYDAMGRQLDMEPSEQTQALVADIKMGRIAPVAVPAPTRPAEPVVHTPVVAEVVPPVVPNLPGGIPVVAVLPIRPIGSTETACFIADAVTEDLTRALATLREPAVVSSISVRNIPIDGLDMPQISRRLGAGYLVSGSVHSLGTSSRVSVELSQASTGTVMWRNSYRIEPKEVFDALEHIAANVANALGPQVSAAELRRNLGDPPEDLSAYHLLLRARELAFRMEQDALEEAGRYITEAIRRDPGYAGAYVGQAFWYGLRMFQGWSPDRGTDTAALMTAARTALRLDPHHVRALALLGHHLMLAEHKFDDAESAADRAVAAAPSDAEVLINATLTCAYIGRTADAISRAERAILLSPNDPLLFRSEHFLSLAYYAAGEFGSAAEWGLKSWRRKPSYTSNIRVTAASLAALGRVDEARALIEQHRLLQPEYRAKDAFERIPFLDVRKRTRIAELLNRAGLP